jgi:hypothetical protein
VERLSPAATVRESAGLDNDQAQLGETAAAAIMAGSQRLTDDTLLLKLTPK